MSTSAIQKFVAIDAGSADKARIELEKMVERERPELLERTSQIEFSLTLCFDDNNHGDQLFYWIGTAWDVRLLIFGAPGLHFIY